MTEQERLELQLEQDAKTAVEALQRLFTNTDAFELKFGPPVTDTRTDKITWTAKHVRNFLDNNGQASAGDHWDNLLSGMYVV
jgi:hypothetical protein